MVGVFCLFTCLLSFNLIVVSCLLLYSMSQLSLKPSAPVFLLLSLPIMVIVFITCCWLLIWWCIIEGYLWFAFAKQMRTFLSSFLNIILLLACWNCFVICLCNHVCGHLISFIFPFWSTVVIRWFVACFWSYVQFWKPIFLLLGWLFIFLLSLFVLLCLLLLFLEWWMKNNIDNVISSCVHCVAMCWYCPPS